MSGPLQFCTFFLERHCFGIDLLEVQEIIRFQPLTRVPLAPRALTGLINLRGQVVTAIDLRERLDLPPRPADEEPMNIVIRTPDGAVSFLVDRIGEVCPAETENFEPVPETLTGPVRDLVTGVQKLPDRLLLILDAIKAATLSIQTALATPI